MIQWIKEKICKKNANYHPEIPSRYLKSKYIPMQYKIRDSYFDGFWHIDTYDKTIIYKNLTYAEICSEANEKHLKDSLELQKKKEAEVKAMITEIPTIFKADTKKSLEDKMKEHLIKHYFTESTMKQIDIKVDIASALVNQYGKPLGPVKQSIIFDVKKSKNNMDIKLKSVNFEPEELAILLRANETSRTAAMNHANLLLADISELGSRKHAIFADRVDKEIAAQSKPTYGSVQVYKEAKKEYSRGFEVLKW